MTYSSSRKIVRFYFQCEPKHLKNTYLRMRVFPISWMYLCVLAKQMKHALRISLKPEFALSLFLFDFPTHIVRINFNTRFKRNCSISKTITPENQSASPDGGISKESVFRIFILSFLYPFPSSLLSFSVSTPQYHPFTLLLFCIIQLALRKHLIHNS